MDKLTTVIGYPVLAQKPAHAAGLGTVETVYVLCHLTDNPHTPFATWEYGLECGAYWGHYSPTLEEALADYTERGTFPVLGEVEETPAPPALPTGELAVTPGPWKLTVEPIDPLTGEGGVFVHDHRVTIAVCDASTRLEMAEILANAHLLRAAPELYAALDALVRTARASGLEEWVGPELKVADAALGTVLERRAEVAS